MVNFFVPGVEWSGL